MEQSGADLRSDTVTRPSPAMRRVMAEAEVGDDVLGEDPSVNALEESGARLLGKEAAVFVPSGTMANLLAFLSQTRPGETVILSESAHPFHYEGANLAAFGGLLTRTIPGAEGKFDAGQAAAQIVQADDPHLSHTTLVAIENTSNRGGGAFYRIEEAAALGALCRERGLKLHCDGARLFNAVVASGTAAAEYARHCDTVSFCLSKGLGAPVGSLLCGTQETMHRARRYRKMLGGGMRQAGVIAAAGLHALENHIGALAGDHRRARQFRQALEEKGVRFPLPSPTNIVYMETPDAPGKRQALQARGVKMYDTSPTRLRAVFHRDITDAHLEFAIAVCAEVLGQ